MEEGEREERRGEEDVKKWEDMIKGYGLMVWT
jgi:hypothetical protein